MVAVEFERTIATRKLVGVICSSCRASVVGPQERQIMVFLGRGCDSKYFPTSNNTNKSNILNGVLAPRRGILAFWKFNHLGEKLDTQPFHSFQRLTFRSVEPLNSFGQ